MSGTGGREGGPERRTAPIFPLRPVVVGAFVPVFLFEAGVGAMLPLVPVAARHLGASLAVAGLLAALLPLGKIAANLPAGELATRWGDRGAMVAASLLGAFAFAVVATAPALPALAIGVATVGASSAVFALARHSYLTHITPVDRRSRVLSTLGGVHRIGTFVGPFAGALAIHLAGVAAAFWFAASCALAALVVLLVNRESAAGGEGPAQADPVAFRAGLRGVLADHRRLLATLGLAVVLVGATRGTRHVVVPLWLARLDIDPTVISLVFGLSAAVDMLLFYPAGRVMDRHGRLWVAVPAMVVMSASLVALPFTSGVTTVSVVAMTLGLGNGLSAGTLMTLGADVAPPHARATFLSLWRLCQDSGDAAGPLVLAGAAALGSLATGIWVMAAAGGAAATALARWVPRFSPHANRAARRRAGLDPVTGAPPRPG